MSASHNGSPSGTTAPATGSPNGLAPLSSLGSTDQNWLGLLQSLGYMPNSGTWLTQAQAAKAPTTGTASSGLSPLFKNGS